jgi:hypothetical protein
MYSVLIAKVLRDPRSRQLYDLSRDRSGPSVLRAAAASGVNAAAGGAYDEVEVRGGWGGEGTCDGALPLSHSCTMSYAPRDMFVLPLPTARSAGCTNLCWSAAAAGRLVLGFGVHVWAAAGGGGLLLVGPRAAGAAGVRRGGELRVEPRFELQEAAWLECETCLACILCQH